MEILRVPPYNTAANIEVNLASNVYTYTIEDMVDHSVITGTATSSEKKVITVPLSSHYDGQYSINVDDEEIFVDVVRPYVNPRAMSNKATEIAEYTKHEEYARAIIDSVVPDGFYYKKSILQTTGIGAEYIPLWMNARKVLAVYENNQIIYDASAPGDYERSYSISKDHTAVVKDYDGYLNRIEGSPINIPLAASDSSDVSFVRNRFYNGFDKIIFEGTGNLIVDKILSKYKDVLRAVRVL
jgi:hypothetical protein